MDKDDQKVYSYGEATRILSEGRGFIALSPVQSYFSSYFYKAMEENFSSIVTDEQEGQSAHKIFNLYADLSYQAIDKLEQDGLMDTDLKEKLDKSGFMDVIDPDSRIAEPSFRQMGKDLVTGQTQNIMASWVSRPLAHVMYGQMKKELLEAPFNNNAGPSDKFQLN